MASALHHSRSPIQCPVFPSPCGQRPGTCTGVCGVTVAVGCPQVTSGPRRRGNALAQTRRLAVPIRPGGASWLAPAPLRSGPAARSCHPTILHQRRATCPLSRHTLRARLQRRAQRHQGYGELMRQRRVRPAVRMDQGNELPPVRSSVARSAATCRWASAWAWATWRRASACTWTTCVASGGLDARVVRFGKGTAGIGAATRRSGPRSGGSGAAQGARHSAGSAARRYAAWARGASGRSRVRVTSQATSCQVHNQPHLFLHLLYNLTGCEFRSITRCNTSNGATYFILVDILRARPRVHGRIIGRPRGTTIALTTVSRRSNESRNSWAFFFFPQR